MWMLKFIYDVVQFTKSFQTQKQNIEDNKTTFLMEETTKL